MNRGLWASYRHLKWFGHWPAWRSIANFWVCERCIKPPSRPRRWWQLQWAPAPARNA